MGVKFAIFAYIITQIVYVRNVYPLEVMVRGSESPLQVGEDLYSIT